VKLTVREAAAALNVPETAIYRWVDEETIPFVTIHHHPMFHRLELLEWAMAMEIPVSADLYEGERGQPFTSALARGGGRMIRDSLAELAATLPISSVADREVIRSVIAARGSELFVNPGADKIAIPKARSPVICPDAPALVTLWWCEHRALMIDTRPANVVFLILAPTIKQHLQLLSRLSLALHDRAFRTAVQSQGEFDQVVAEARRWEQALEAAAPGTQGASR
jgi:excisionase family DNA binding protein